MFFCDGDSVPDTARDAADTATGFTLAQIEANPPGFFADVHTTTYPAGAIRGQIELDESAY